MLIDPDRTWGCEYITSNSEGRTIILHPRFMRAPLSCIVFEKLFNMITMYSLSQDKDRTLFIVHLVAKELSG